jgi:hypothetical protein
VLACIAQTPGGKATYLAMEKCGYCDYCGAACDTSEYCTALDNPSDVVTTDAGSDSSTDAGSDGSAADSSTD